MFSCFYGGVGALLYFYKKMNELKDKALSNEKVKITAELNALKAQINPHLLFNTLNNIYSLSLEKSEMVPGMILKLSDLMSYVLYECKKSEVSLASEIEFIRNYIELEKMRFEDTIDISFTVKIKNPELRISPLLFIPFIENVFKHNSSSKGQRRMIIIELEERTNKLLFVSKNSVNLTLKQKDNLYSGIGIQNVTKRLQYLYAENYILDISCSDSIYQVKLEINIV
jgi:LytS/YehU family sensor histidine kinase